MVQKRKAENYLHRMALSRSLFVHKLDLSPVDQRWKHGSVLSVSGELAIISSGKELESLLPRHVSRADVWRKNKR
jgi:hypothetical protein